MNKCSKGMTLIEILVSVALISLVLIFIFNIMLDLKHEDREANRNSSDSFNRASLIRIIQNDFIQNELKSVEKCDNVVNGVLCYKFNFKKEGVGPKEFVIYNSDNKSNIIYDDEMWELSTTYNLDSNKRKFEYTTTQYLVDESSSSQYDFTYGYLYINIPANVKYVSNRKFNIELIYSSKNLIDIKDKTLITT